MHINSFLLLRQPGRWVLFLKLRKLRHRKGKNLLQGYSISERQSLDLTRESGSKSLLFCLFSKYRFLLPSRTWWGQRLWSLLFTDELPVPMFLADSRYSINFGRQNEWKLVSTILSFSKANSSILNLLTTGTVRLFVSLLFISATS